MMRARQSLAGAFGLAVVFGIAGCANYFQLSQITTNPDAIEMTTPDGDTETFTPGGARSPNTFFTRDLTTPGVYTFRAPGQPAAQVRITKRTYARLYVHPDGTIYLAWFDRSKKGHETHQGRREIFGPDVVRRAIVDAEGMGQGDPD